MENLLPDHLSALSDLRPMEVRFREYYDIWSAAEAVRPTSSEYTESLLMRIAPDYADLLELQHTPVLEENSFFANGLDIAIFQHMRWMHPDWHEHDFFELSYVLSGHFTNFYGDSSFSTGEGDILLISPHTKHAVFTSDENGVMINILIRKSTFERHFMHLLPEDGLLQAFFSRALYQKSDHPYLRFAAGSDDILWHALNRIYEEYTRSHEYRGQMQNALLAEFFILLLRRHAKDVTIPGGAAAQNSENTIFILQYMQSHYASVTLKELADFFSYSERQIERIISAATGSGFRQNIMQIRMHHASQMLAKTDLSIQEIAEQNGFFDSSHFRQSFKKNYGQTPAEYRNAQR